MLVKEIMERNYPTIFTDERATKARAILRERRLRMLPVVDEHKILVGVISRNHLMQITSSISPMTVKGLMDANPYSVAPDLDVVQAMREMVRRDEWYVPVVKSSQNLGYLGVLGFEDYMRISLEKNFVRLSTPLSEIMSKELLTCTPEDEIDNIWQKMKQRSLSACPVVKRGKAVGIITQQNLLESGGIFPRFEAHKGPFRAPSKVSFVMKTPVISLKPSDSVREAAAIMLERNIGRLPIVDEKGKLSGIVDRQDIVEALVK